MTTPSVAPGIFGQVITGSDVEGWALDTLQEWSSTYLSELERQHGYEAGTLARVKSWSPAQSLDKWPESQLPAVILVSVGLTRPPLRGGSGLYLAEWALGIGCVCSARTEKESREQAMLYVAAHRAILIQRPSLGGHCFGVTWLDENYDQLAYDDTRTLFAGMASFAVQVDDVTMGDGGPLSPDAPLDPDTSLWPEWPDIETFDIEVDNHPVDRKLP